MIELTDHGLTCDCGETFPNADALNDHITVQQTIDEIQRIGGPRFAHLTAYYEGDAHSGDLKGLARATDVAFTPENATTLAKKAIIQIVESYHAHEDTIEYATERAAEGA